MFGITPEELRKREERDQQTIYEQYDKYHNEWFQDNKKARAGQREY